MVLIEMKENITAAPERKKVWVDFLLSMREKVTFTVSRSEETSIRNAAARCGIKITGSREERGGMDLVIFKVVSKPKTRKTK
jgi:hypothetical protein